MEAPRAKTIIPNPTVEDIESLTIGGGIFSPENIKPDTLRRILKHSSILSYRYKTVLYDQGMPARNLELFVILSGEFAVWHIYPAKKATEKPKRVHVATDKPGDLAGDVEMLLRTSSHTSQLTVPERDLSATQTWSRRICTKAGRVLSIDIRRFFDEVEGQFVLNIDDSKFMTAIARQLAVKLVERSAQYDPSKTKPRKDQVVDCLQTYIKKRPELTHGNPPQIMIDESLQYFADEIGCSRQTVAGAIDALPTTFRDKYKKLWVRRSFWENQEPNP